MTLVVVLDPSASFTRTAPVAKGVIETAVTIVASLVAYLLFGRYRRRLRSSDLAIATAIGVLAISGPVFVALPAALGGPLVDVGSWLLLIARVGSAGLLLWASGDAAVAVAAERTGRPGPQAQTRRRASAFGIVALTVVAAVLILTVFHYDPDQRGVGAASNVPDPLSQPAYAVVQLLCLVLFFSAGIRFAHRADTSDDALLRWVSVGCVVIGFASLDYSLFPRLDPDVLHVGDIMRAAAVFVFALAAMAEIRSYWSESTRLARLEERRAVARDLHDGVAQELAFLACELQQHSAAHLDDQWLGRVRSASERALAESRRAIAALVSDGPPSLDNDLERAVGHIASDAGASLELDVEPSRIDPTSWEVLVRIAREAVINAVRHGRASSIRIQLDGDDAPVLRVIDDGVGFDLASLTASQSKFGLLTMGERAHSIGARLAVSSQPGGGTVVEVSWAPE